MLRSRPTLFGGCLVAGALLCAQGDAQDQNRRMVTYTEDREPCAEYTPERRALFGDLHVHTSFSFDAAALTIGSTPEDANDFAQGKPIAFWPLDEEGRPKGRYALDRPLDFLAVTDHGEFLGERRLCNEPDSPRYDTAFCTAARTNQRQGMLMLGQVVVSENPERIAEVCGEDGKLCRDYARSPWQRMAAAADAANDRTASCKFTSFVAYEYTGTPGTSNYHRNVIFRNSNVPELPVSYVDAPYDSLLWEQLDAACREDDGCSYLTIPHNTNLANGRMAPYQRIDATMEARREYARTRLRREPIMEIFQHKGASECINGLTSVLAAPDELCDIEAVRTIGQEESFITASVVDGQMRVQPMKEVTEECEGGSGSNGMLGAGCVDATDFQRSGLLVGLKEEQVTGLNPVKLGVIASTDTHTATPGAAHEDDWRGHVSVEATSDERLLPGLLTSGIDGNPGGLAGVWAVENSRDAIFEAMLRREVFGTSGTRIVPRLFVGWDYPEDLCSQSDLARRGYANGVAMGGDLSAAPDGGKPTIVASALRDPASRANPLEQLQLIKGWIDAEGRMHSEVRTIAGEAGSEGSPSLCTVYRDASFDPALPTYYYLRVVETPSPRWHTFDCERLPQNARPAVCESERYPQVLREMAWTSPVWYRPTDDE